MGGIWESSGSINFEWHPGQAVASPLHGQLAQPATLEIQDKTADVIPMGNNGLVHWRCNAPVICDDDHGSDPIQYRRETDGGCHGPASQGVHRCWRVGLPGISGACPSAGVIERSPCGRRRFAIRTPASPDADTRAKPIPDLYADALAHGAESESGSVLEHVVCRVCDLVDRRLGRRPGWREHAGRTLEWLFLDCH